MERNLVRFGNDVSVAVEEVGRVILALRRLDLGPAGLEHLLDSLGAVSVLLRGVSSVNATGTGSAQTSRLVSFRTTSPLMGTCILGQRSHSCPMWTHRVQCHCHEVDSEHALSQSLAAASPPKRK